jgi:hydroxymethylbilane synthase
MKRPLRLGTRGSPLALAQARLVADALCAAHGWTAEAIEIVPITTTGDVIQDRPLAEVGGKALWTKELDRCLVEGRTDLSVHSMKDVETIRPEALAIVAMLPRADPRDRLIGAQSVAALPEGARVGTSSPRRKAQLLARRPDLRIVPLRGNVATRLAKIERGDADATLLAAAGLDRLGMADTGRPIDVEDMLPAPSQGAIGVEVAAGNEEARALMSAIDHRATHDCIAAERQLLAALGGDCRSAVAAYACLDDDSVWLRAEILAPEGTEIQSAEARFAADDLGQASDIAVQLLAQASPALRGMFVP